MPSGGYRPGSGNKKGVKLGPYKSTITKEQARDAVRAMVIEALKPMVEAQIAHSRGIGHVFTRDKNKKFTRIEDMEQATQLLTQGEEGKDYWIFMKDPSVQAFTDLLNRALDKPKEQLQELQITGKLDIVGTLAK